MKKQIDYFERKKQRDETREFWKERRLIEQTEIARNDMTREFDMKNICQECYVMRSPFEIERGLCDSCDNEKAVV